VAAGIPVRGRLATRISVVTALVVTFATVFTAAGLGVARSGLAGAGNDDGVYGSASQLNDLASGVKGDPAIRAMPPIPLSLRQSIAGTYTIPGTAPELPWPAHGQAAMEVLGLGSLGTSGPLDSPVSIASVTKTMTALLILEDHPLAPGQDGPTITVTAVEAEVYQKEADTTDDSLVVVKAGEQLTERDALYALMLASADNMAAILAQWDAGSVPAFLGKMNAMAAQLGMAHTLFTDPSGLASSTTSTAEDLLKLGAAAIQRADFRQIVATPEALIPVVGYIRNYNRLLGVDGVIGIKTGSTDAAGSCLLFAADVTLGGKTETVIGAVLGQQLGGGAGVVSSALEAAHKLVLGAEAALTSVDVAAPGTTVAVLVRGGVHSGRLTVAAPVVVVGWPGLAFQVTVSGTPGAASIAVSGGTGQSPVATEPLQSE
jgi:serine-type D-Ala-D-Ala carboxypeptidase (penicillin-binding protein 5/6)